MHATAFRKFGQIRNFVFVLDGDKRDSDLEERIRQRAGSDVPVFFLPGGEAPETWIWNALRRNPDRHATDLGIDSADLVERMNRLDAVYDTAADRPGEIAKTKLHDLAEPHGWTPPDIGRAVRPTGGQPQGERHPAPVGWAEGSSAAMAWGVSRMVFPFVSGYSVGSAPIPGGS